MLSVRGKQGCIVYKMTVKVSLQMFMFPQSTKAMIIPVFGRIPIPE
jgi:hypothetical protein